MREIKFRAYDCFSKAWLNERISVRLDGDILFDGKDGMLPKECDIKIMQYTGLKDKNGKDIYEGDIVIAEWTTEGLPEYPDEKDWLCFIGEVEWKKDSLGWGFKTNPLEWWHTHCPVKSLKKLTDEGCMYSSRYSLTRDMGEDAPELEVLGNIYENPELLKDR